MRRWVFPLLTFAITILPTSNSSATPGSEAVAVETGDRAGNPPTLSATQQSHYRRLFAAIDAGDWTTTTALLDAGTDPALDAYARADYYLAPTSPKIPLDAIVDLLTRAPDLPQAAQLAKLAQKRGGIALPMLPVAQRLVYQGNMPRRDFNLKSVADPVAQSYAPQMFQAIKDDDPGAGEALLNGISGQISPAALTEWQYRLAWSYYLCGDDANARRLAEMAQTGSGTAAAQAFWAGGLASWRMGDYRAAATAFEQLARASGDDEMRAAGNYWASRAYLAGGNPARVSAALKAAARLDETFYGILAREALGLPSAGVVGGPPASLTASAPAAADLASRPNARLAMMLTSLGENERADAALRHQAKIGDSRDYPALLALARALDLPGAQLYLAYYAPAGQRPDRFARYPLPKWTPQGGWRVDRALVMAHALEESGFRNNAVSAAGATGLLQVRPGTARDMAAARGAQLGDRDLRRPEINMEYGQSYIERLRDSSTTGGVLPKVIAAYNAGPVPVARWNSTIKAGNDPLLFIESIPYWETRGYVGIVLRNYWMYKRQTGEHSKTLTAMTQGKWPAFPDTRTRTAAGRGFQSAN